MAVDGSWPTCVRSVALPRPLWGLAQPSKVTHLAVIPKSGWVHRGTRMMKALALCTDKPAEPSIGRGGSSMLALKINRQPHGRELLLLLLDLLLSSSSVCHSTQHNTNQLNQLGVCNVNPFWMTTYVFFSSDTDVSGANKSSSSIIPSPSEEGRKPNCLMRNVRIFISLCD